MLESPLNKDLTIAAKQEPKIALKAARKLALEVALEVANETAEIILAEYKKFVAIENAPSSITTHVDHLAQENLLKRISAYFPNDGYCAEEKTPTLALLTEERKKRAETPKRIWIIDPIDGTRGFATKNDQFSIMIGLFEDNKIVLGVVVEPVRMRRTFAISEEGCWKQDGSEPPTRCSVSQVKSLKEATLVQSLSKTPFETPIAKLIQPKKTIGTHSAGIKLALVARGEADIYVNNYQRFYDWDISAGHCLVIEAGGIATELSGKELQYQKEDFSQIGGIFATNPELHPQAKSAIQSLLWT